MQFYTGDYFTGSAFLDFFLNFHQNVMIRKAVSHSHTLWSKQCYVLFYEDSYYLIEDCLCTLNEMVASQTALVVWKSNKAKDLLGRNLFPKQDHHKANQSLLTIFWLQTSWQGPGTVLLTTIRAPKSATQKWAHNLLTCFLTLSGHTARKETLVSI